ncbi:MAG: hypothetical protein Q4A78_07040 [Peptostreptococcaceae bacterium]|nr:hypothetical protein [Peptostreptococcaceae bacterium]
MSALYQLSGEARTIMVIFLYLAIGLQAGNIVLLNMGQRVERKKIRNLISVAILACLILSIYILSRLFMNVYYGTFADPLPLIKIAPEYARLVLVGFIVLNILLITKVAADFFTCWYEISTSITRLSIKEAMDKIPVGNMFCSEDDRILFVNPAMNRAMKELGFREYESGERFWSKICGMDVVGSNIRCESACEQERDVCILRTDEGSSWEFSKTEVRIRDRRYMNISAIDVSEKDKLNIVLNNQYEELREIERELRKMGETIRKSQQEQAVLELKNRIHDIMGQRLSIIHQILESNRHLSLSLKELQRLLGTMLFDLKDREAEDPKRIFENIKRSCALIGVSLSLQGEFIGTEDQKKLMMKVIREAVTNAVRHARAKKIEVDISESLDEIHMKIVNDGELPQDSISEKQGISGMRRRAAEQDGHIHIISRPIFAVLLRLPKKSEEPRTGR